ncbi:MAG: CBS domain-containing protein [Candidatus Latescibacteria bacterium]|nr:CBS domain-containing protein [Candidatus Latescibacterota bacterium]
MEPPQFILTAADLPAALLYLFILSLSLLLLWLLGSYEATYAVLSRSVLEKMQENNTPRAAIPLRLYAPRDRLALMRRLGDAIGVLLLSLTSYAFAGLILQPAFYALPLAVVLVLVCLALTSLARRLRLEENGDDRIPALILAFVPLHLVLHPLASLIVRITGRDGSSEDFKAEKEEEIRSIVEAESETGVLEKGETEMIQGVFGFHDSIVREVMIPRVDIVAMDQADSLADLLQLLQEKGHSRVPIYDETLDQIRGIVYAKDLLNMLKAPQIPDLQTPLLQFVDQVDAETPFLRQPTYVPETKKIDELLLEFRTAKTRLALVVDEYGGTAGLVTLEDLVEEIIGEIQDEYDDEEALFHWREPDDILIAEARIAIDDLNEVLESDFPSEGFETLGGLIYDHLGRIPDLHQSFTLDQCEFTILTIEGQRIGQVQIRRLPPEEDD